MTPGTMAEALAPLKRRMPQIVREQEILRVAASISCKNSPLAAQSARQEVLAWAQKRCGGRLPQEAWDQKSFEYFAGGRTSIGVRIQADSSDIWAIRADDPDKNVPGRTWTTEVTIGHTSNGEPRLGVRLLVNTAEDTLEIEPHSPGFVQQIVEKCSVLAGGYSLDSAPWTVSSGEEVGQLIDMLEDPARTLPVFVASGDERSANSHLPLLDAESLAKATLGLAHVVVLPAGYTYLLSDYFGKIRSVFFGAVRVYMPGFGSDSEPYDHKLFLADNLQTATEVTQCVFWLRSFAATESLRRTRLGHDVLPFVSVRNAALRLQQENQAARGASEGEQLQSALSRIKALEEELRSAKDWESQLYNLHRDAESRAETAEAQASASMYRIQQLLDQLKEQGNTPDAHLALPATWSDLADWCDINLAGRLVLAPSARRGVKAPIFQDLEQAVRCLLWLANECRDRRINGGGSLADEPIEDGVRNASCGGDAYEFDWRGRRLTADWHIKNGGTTRDPTRCLRIYYAWDSSARQIVVADMPAHQRTGAT